MLFDPPPSGGGVFDCEEVKYVKSVSTLIFSTNGAWYTLRFPASFLFSWVCMFCSFMF